MSDHISNSNGYDLDLLPQFNVIKRDILVVKIHHSSSSVWYRILHLIYTKKENKGL